MADLAARVPLRGPPRYWRPLVVAELLAVAALVGSMLVTLATPARTGLPTEVYESLLVAVVFAGPPVAGLVTGALGGGLVRALGLAAVPSLAWTLTVPAGYALRQAFGYPLPTPDSPLWAISGAFLVIGLGSGLAGFLVGRLVAVLWRRSRAQS